MDTGVIWRDIMGTGKRPWRPCCCPRLRFISIGRLRLKFDLGCSVGLARLAPTHGCESLGTGSIRSILTPPLTPPPAGPACLLCGEGYNYPDGFWPIRKGLSFDVCWSLLALVSGQCMTTRCPCGGRVTLMGHLRSEDALFARTPARHGPDVTPCVFSNDIRPS